MDPVVLFLAAHSKAVVEAAATSAAVTVVATRLEAAAVLVRPEAAVAVPSRALRIRFLLEGIV